MKKLSLIIIFIFLLALTVTGFANGGSTADGNLAIGTGAVVVQGEDNDAKGVGAAAGLGSGNAAIGTGAVVENGKHNEAKGVGAAAGLGDNNLAIGTGAAVVSGHGNDAAGIGALAGLGNNNIAEGTGAIVEGGKRNNAQGIGAIAGMGVQNAASGVGAHVLSGTTGADISGIGAIAGMGDYNTAVGIGAVVGADAQIGVSSGNEAAGYGAWASGTDNKAFGYGAQAYGNANTAIGAGAIATAGNSVAIGAGSIADSRPNTVSVGTPGYERQIINVAPGYYGTDAVNMSQLWAVDSKVNRVGAMAFAMSALAPMAYDPQDPTQYSAGLGSYNGTAAVALGVYHYTKPTVMLNAAVAMSDDKWEKSARFGVTWKTGGPKPKALVPANATPVDKAAAPQSDIMSRINKIIAETENP